MELIDCYLQAVKFWLPKNQKQDIVAELSEDLGSQIEDREAELGRKLNESEVADLLKQRGRPIMVANRYRPQQQLIGPALFPVYLFVLEVVGSFYLVPWVLVWITIAIIRPAHPGQSLITTIGQFWATFWPTAFFTVGSITTIFAILERVQNKSKFMEDWDPQCRHLAFDHDGLVGKGVAGPDVEHFARVDNDPLGRWLTPCAHGQPDHARERKHSPCSETVVSRLRISSAFSFML